MNTKTILFVGLAAVGIAIIYMATSRGRGVDHGAEKMRLRANLNGGGGAVDMDLLNDPEIAAAQTREILDRWEQETFG